MSFFSLLLIFFLILILRPIIRGYLAMRRMRRQMQEMFDAARRDPRQSAGQGSSSTPQQPRHEKVYGRDAGEYVAFEEIEASETVATEETPEGTTTVVEQQISDAEWEEIR